MSQVVSRYMVDWSGSIFLDCRKCPLMPTPQSKRFSVQVALGEINYSSMSWVPCEIHGGEKERFTGSE